MGGTERRKVCPKKVVAIPCPLLSSSNVILPFSSSRSPVLMDIAEVGTNFFEEVLGSGYIKRHTGSTELV